MTVTDTDEIVRRTREPVCGMKGGPGMTDIRNPGRAALAAAGLLLVAAPAWAGSTERVSVSSSGEQGNADSLGRSLSADGRFVAFTSYATNLVPGDTNGAGCDPGSYPPCGQDVLVRDRKLGTTERVSLSSSGKQANGDSGLFGLSLSADGRFVAFTSKASNLVPGDTNDAPDCSACGYDVFVRDRKLRTTERVSVGPHGRQANGNSFGGAISAHGRLVAFVSPATNLVPGGAAPTRCGQGDRGG